jgi:hypothetical protein
VSFQRLLFRVAKNILGLRNQVLKENNMNWVFETYSNVYATAMMQPAKTAPMVKADHKPILARLFKRG